MLALALGGCVCGQVGSAPGTLAIDSLEPALAVAGVRTPLKIHGSGLRTELVTDLGGQTASADALSVTVGATPLKGAELAADGTIKVTLPDSIAPGVYQVSVSLGARHAQAATALEVVAPVELALQAPKDLASGEESQFSLQVTSRAPSDVGLAVDSLAAVPEGALEVGSFSLPAMVGAEPVEVFGKLASMHPAGTADATLAVAIRWSLGPLTGTVDASAAVRAFGVPVLSASFAAPAEIELGDQQSISAQLFAPAGVDVGHLDAQVTAGGGAALAADVSVSGGTLAAGAMLALSGSVQGASTGPGFLQLDATASAARGDAPAPLSTRRALTVRSGPAPAISALALPGVVEVGVPVSVEIEARNDGDVDLDGAQLSVSADQGLVSPASASLALAAGASVKQTITVVPQTAGAPVQLMVALSGASALSGRAFAAQPASAASGVARRPAALSMTATPAQTRASVGQKIPLAVQITNAGDVDVPAAVLSIAASGSGLLLDASGNPVSSLQLPPAAVPAGGSVALSATAVGNAPVAASFTLSVSGADPVSGANVTASAGARFDVQVAPLLSLQATGPARLVSGQSAALDVVVSNTGGADALSVAPTAQVSGPIGAGSPSPASVAVLAAGTSVHFSILVLANSPAGSSGISLGATGQDGNGAGPVSASGAVSIAVQDAPHITASFSSALPATATEGQTLPALTLHLAAAGAPSADAQLAALPVLTVSGSGTATPQLPCTLPCALPAGGALDVPVQIVAGTAGNLQVTASFPSSAPPVVDADQGAAVAVASVSTTAVQVQTAGALAVQVQSPQLVEGFTSTVTVTLTNTGGADVGALALAALDVKDASGAAVATSSVSALGAGPLAGGAHESFTFNVAPAAGAGSLAFHVRITGTETNTSAARTGETTTAPFTVSPPGGLVVNLQALPASASVGQSLSLSVVVTNTGGTAVNSVLASLSQRGAAGDGAVTITGPAEAAQTLNPSASATFTFQVVVTAAGPVELTASASGTLQGGGAAAVTPSVRDTTAQAPAQLSATLTTDRTLISVGQALMITLMVQNTGGADADNVSAAAPTLASGSTAAVAAIAPVAAGAVSVLHAGQSASFTWSTSATSAGQVAFVSSAQGTDANDATMTPSTGAVTSATVQAQARGQLAISAAAGPARVSAGLQTASLTLTASNPGGADVVLAALPAPSALTTGSAAVTVAAQPASAAGLTLHSGDSRDFVWTFNASGSGTVYWQASASATESNTGQTLSPAPASSGSIVVEPPAALSLSLAATPPQVSAGLQRVQLALTATNTGGAALRLDALPAPTLLATSTAGATVATSPAPTAGTTLAGGASQTFTWQYNVSGSGTLTFSAGASGTDADSGTAVHPPAATAAAVTVLAPAALSASAAAAPSRVSAGLQQVSLVLTLQNAGGAGLKLLALPAPVVTPGGSAAATLSSSPASPAGNVLAGGATASYTWVWNVSGSGTLAFSLSASGTDVNAGNTVGPVSAASQPVTVQAPGALAVSAAASPASASAGQNVVSFTLVARNSGGADVTLDALPSPTIAATGTAGATLSSAPAPAAGTVLSGGSQLSFTWQYNVSGSGTLSFTGSASGVEANTQGALKPAAVTSSPVSVQKPGQLAIAAGASPSQVSSGAQQISLTLSVQNTGEADVVLDALPLPAVTATGSASANAASAPASTAGSVLSGGVSKTFTWTWNVGGVGTVAFSASASGKDGNSGVVIAPAPAAAGPVTVQTSGALSLAIAATPSQVSAGQQKISLTLTVTNTGGASVVLDALSPPTVAASGSAAAVLVSSPASPAGTALAGGASTSFIWSYSESGSGTLAFTAGASGKESNTGNAIAPTPVTSQTVTVQAPAALSLSATATPGSVSAGLQRVSLTLTLHNAGGASVRLDALPAPVVSATGTAAAAIFSSPASTAGTLLAGGGSATYTWQYDVSGSGTLSFSASASGADANSAAVLAPPAAAAGPVTVQQPAKLSLSASLNLSTLSAGLQQLQLTLKATNSGGAGAVLAALPAPTLTATGTASASLVSSPASPAGTTLAGGANQSFVWTYSAAGSGTLSFSTSASGTDANAGTAVTATAASAGPATVQKPAMLSISSIAASPSVVQLNGAIDVAVTVHNSGEASALQVQLAGLSASSTAAQNGSPTPASATIAGGGSAVFHVAYTAQSEGSFTATAGASGSDANAGTAVSAAAATSSAITVTALQVAVTFPGAGATLQAGGSLTAVASARNTNGAAVTQLSLSATGSGSVSAPSSVTGTRPTLGATFTVAASSSAATGSSISLTATALDAAGSPISSAPVSITIGPPVVLALICHPQQGLSIAAGQSDEARLEAQMSDGSAQDATLSASWSPSNATIATVSAGIVHGVAAGSAGVTASYGGHSASCAVRVRAAAPSYGVEPADPVLLGLSGQFPLQFFEYLSAALPTNLTGTATWTSSNTSVATVSGGTVTGKSSGTATIQACVASNCASTLAIVGATIDTASYASYQRFAIGGAQTFSSLWLRSGTVTYLGDAAVGLSLNVGSFQLDSGAILAGDGRAAPSTDSSITTFGQGGDGSSGAGGGGGGGGSGSNFCSGANCGGGGATAGSAPSCGLNSTCGGGSGAAGSAGGAGGPQGGLLGLLGPPIGDAGGGGGDGGGGGRGGSVNAGTFSSSGGGLGVLDGNTGGNGGGGGNAGSGSGPGGGGGGGGGAILFSGNASAQIRIDGLVSLEGGGGGMLRSAINGGPGGAGAGGSFFVSASSGNVTGAGTVIVRGGVGGGGPSNGTCGGGGGGGGGIIQLAAPEAGPTLVTLVEGGAGGQACGGGQNGETGAKGQLNRP